MGADLVFIIIFIFRELDYEIRKRLREESIENHKLEGEIGKSPYILSNIQELQLFTICYPIYRYIQPYSDLICYLIILIYPGLVAYYSGIFYISPFFISLYSEGLILVFLLLSSFILLININNLNILIRIYLNYVIKN